ncbi:hypothetical protein HAX54_014392 [Datura stramonium]|uniref:Uncharacterized protein n=1 Tax=Datura stramonium TaxID=4076 RepID=A0ABS8TPW4_DATST|nr:hypothetical protein [Datura stramonium]
MPSLRLIPGPQKVEKWMEDIFKIQQGDIYTGDMVTAIEETKEPDPKTDNESLDMKDVEVEFEQATSETIYVNGYHFRGNFKEDATKIKSLANHLPYQKIITGSEQILKADGEATDKIDDEVDHEDLISNGQIDSIVFGSFEAVEHLSRIEKEILVMDLRLHRKLIIKSS